MGAPRVLVTGAAGYLGRQLVAALAADPQIPAGSKFESFAWTDHLLGLDLARDIGR